MTSSDSNESDISNRKKGGRVNGYRATQLEVTHNEVEHFSQTELATGVLV